MMNFIFYTGIYNYSMDIQTGPVVVFETIEMWKLYGQWSIRMEKKVIITAWIVLLDQVR